MRIYHKLLGRATALLLVGRHGPPEAPLECGPRTSSDTSSGVKWGYSTRDEDAVTRSRYVSLVFHLPAWIVMTYLVR